MPDPNEEEQRLTLYLSGNVLDLAEAQATRAGVETIQQYCALLLRQAIHAERARGQVADVEARRGPLSGLRAIADDPEYLAEWGSLTGARDLPPPHSPRALPEPVSIPVADAPDVAVEMPIVARPAPEERSLPAEVVLRHSGQGGDDPLAFLPSLRRGEPPRMEEVAELAQALQTLEDTHHGARALDRRLAYALHRLAFESQVLHTDAYPGAFDEWTVETLRAVQEYVDRILSGQDIRYYPTATRPENPR